MMATAKLGDAWDRTIMLLRCHVTEDVDETDFARINPAYTVVEMSPNDWANHLRKQQVLNDPTLTKDEKDRILANVERLKRGTESSN